MVAILEVSRQLTSLQRTAGFSYCWYKRQWGGERQTEKSKKEETGKVDVEEQKS